MLHFTMHHFGVFLHSEGSTSRRLPDVLLIIIVLADDTHLVTHKVCTVEANAELSNHGHVATSSHGLHKCLGTTLGNGAKIVDQLVLGHANTRILNCQGRIGLVWYNLNVEIWLVLDLLRL